MKSKPEAGTAYSPTKMAPVEVEILAKYIKVLTQISKDISRLWSSQILTVNPRSKNDNANLVIRIVPKAATYNWYPLLAKTSHKDQMTN